MVVVFSGFASGELVEFQQMGFGLAIAVLLDATLVRSVLLPATKYQTKSFLTQCRSYISSTRNVFRGSFSIAG
jgi:hypothetical protein